MTGSNVPTPEKKRLIRLTREALRKSSVDLYTAATSQHGETLQPEKSPRFIRLEFESGVGTLNVSVTEKGDNIIVCGWIMHGGRDIWASTGSSRVLNGADLSDADIIEMIVTRIEKVIADMNHELGLINTQEFERLSKNRHKGSKRKLLRRRLLAT